MHAHVYVCVWTCMYVYIHASCAIYLHDYMNTMTCFCVCIYVYVCICASYKWISILTVEQVEAWGLQDYHTTHKDTDTWETYSAFAAYGGYYDHSSHHANTTTSASGASSLTRQLSSTVALLLPRVRSYTHPRFLSCFYSPPPPSLFLSPSFSHFFLLAHALFWCVC